MKKKEKGVSSGGEERWFSSDADGFARKAGRGRGNGGDGGKREGGEGGGGRERTTEHLNVGAGDGGTRPVKGGRVLEGYDKRRVAGETAEGGGDLHWNFIGSFFSGGCGEGRREKGEGDGEGGGWERGRGGGRRGGGGGSKGDGMGGRRG